MDKMKMRMAALGGKHKEMPFPKEKIDAMRSKKHGEEYSQMAEGLMKEDSGEEKEGEAMEMGELSPDECKLVMAYRKKKAQV